MIYLDNAATTYYKPQPVIDAMVNALKNMGNAGRGAHDYSLDASRMIYETRLQIAELFGLGNPGQVAFTANSTESLNIAIQGIFKEGDHVITTQMEHNSVLRPLYLMEERGVQLTILPVDKKGCINYEELSAAICDHTKGFVCTHASNLTGNLIDIERVGNICKSKHILFILDASQSAGVFDIDMKEMGIDVVCFTGHKSLQGPQGIGGICVKEGLHVNPLIVGGSGTHSYSKTHPIQMPEALEAGTLNGHSIAGLHASLHYINELGIDLIREKEIKLMEKFYQGIAGIDGVKVYGDFTTPIRAPIVTLNIKDYDSAEVADELQINYQIATRAGAHCAPLLHQALGTMEQGSVRFSFSYSNTNEEIEQAIFAVSQIAMA